MCVAIPLTYLAWLIANGWPAPLVTLGAVLVETLFWLGSRDTFRNYNQRLASLLAKPLSR